ncbi:hypothetical protein GKZ89_04835 [Bacillus mangrovi]|uniref:Flagellar hook-length control protein-like C-terminal domain-containing protein n=1 Tax=Metabacillus mangrovi TaxID=1491830 RepID=A0A7X2V445_9BACI|nr:hypothetical protein [Metabacillus mangrovi]MTH52726.1 hypothetical protein [Metabacillus mangrovi]
MDPISAGLHHRLLQSMPPGNELKLQNGQLVMGRVVELYPSQRALLQIGAHKTLAAVEAPLIKGAEYLFKAVVSGENSIPGLKIIRAHGGGSGANGTAGVAGAGSNVHPQLSGWLLTANIPFTAGDIAAASEWLRSVPEAGQPAGILAAAEAISRKLPLNSRTLSALFEAFKGGRTADDLQELIRLLPDHNPRTAALRQTAEWLLDQSGKREAARVLEAVADASINGSGPNRELALSAAAKLQDPEKALEIMQTLKNTGRHPLFTEEESAWILRQSPEPASAPKELVRLFSMFEKILGPFSETANSGQAKESAFGKLLAQAAEAGGAAGEKADQLLLKLEGRQLLQNEQPGTVSVWHHYPFKNDRILTDVQVHYQLRKNEEGEVDPAFCRLVFYLSLSSLGPVMADVQIQNRIVAASVYSDRDLSPYSSTAGAILKKRFEDLPYRFSGISFKSTEQAKAAPVYPLPGKGFDYRI